MIPSDSERERRPASQGYYATPPSKNKQLEQILDVLYRRRLIIAVVLVLVTAAAAVYSFTRVPSYQTRALIMVDLNQMGGQETITTEGNTPFVRSDRSISTELFILQNSFMINQGVDQRLKEMHEEDASVPYPPTGSVQFLPADRTITNALRVDAFSTDPREAALLANLYAEEYVRQTRESSRVYTVQAHDFLEEQAAKRRDELARAEEAVEEYMERTGAYGLNQSGAAMVSRIAGLEAQRDEARIDLQMKRAELNTVESELNGIDPQLLASRVNSSVDRELNAISADLDKLEQQKREIISAAGPNDPRIPVINAQIADLDRESLQLSDRFVSDVMKTGGVGGEGASAVGYVSELKRNAVQQNISINGLESRVQTMNARLGEYQGELNDIPGQSTELARLERTRQHAEQMYQYIVQRLQETQISLESEPGYARILRKAGVPGAPTGSNPWKRVAMGLLFGLLGGIALAMLRDKIDNRIYKPDQLRDRNVDVIGVIPNLEPHIKKEYGGKDTVEYGGYHVDSHLTALLNPLSSASEAYRHLRTTIQFSRPGVVVQTIVVTSAAPSEGKSTTAANLALTMAQANRRTLLIDADLRRPKQHKLFDRELEPGLYQVLFDQDVPVEAIQTSFDENLYILPAGGLISASAGSSATTLVEEPSEMVGSKRMRDILEMYRGQFDVIIIDTPPVLAATDAVLLSTQADATLVVAAAGQTKDADLSHSLERLDDVGAHIIGTVLNRFDLSMAYGYKYSYGQYGPYSKYSYGPESEEEKPWWNLSRHFQRAS